MRATFAEARATQAAGVALFFQAEPFIAGRWRPGVGREWLHAVSRDGGGGGAGVRQAGAPRPRRRKPLSAGADGEVPERRRPLDNVTRLETFGATDIHAVLVVVDPGSPQVFPPARWIAFERAADPAATKAGAEEEKVTRPAFFRGAAGAATTAASDRPLLQAKRRGGRGLAHARFGHSIFLRSGRVKPHPLLPVEMIHQAGRCAR